MGGALAERPEVARRADDRATEELSPDAVHEHSRGERIRRAGDGAGEIRAAASRREGFRLPVRGVVPSAGAGFVVVLCGDMQRMPGLGRTPAFKNVDIDTNGTTIGLF